MCGNVIPSSEPDPTRAPCCVAGAAAVSTDGSRLISREAATISQASGASHGAPEQIRFAGEHASPRCVTMTTFSTINTFDTLTTFAGAGGQEERSNKALRLTRRWEDLHPSSAAG
ncbi:unnamed protein product [Lampetra fluviatilis]